jgi:ferric-dicitrate binding protein FerR (iron transport regulator)
LKSKKYHFANEVALLPSQKAIFTKNDKQLLINDIDDIYSEIAWKDNQLIIKGERLSDIAVKLERKYDVKIRFDSEAIKAYKFSGTLKDETIQQVMDVVKFSAPIDYKMNGREITLIMNTATINSYDKFLKKTNE